MRARFVAMGGAPVLSAPIYFFLGRNKRFEEHPLNIGYAIDLVHLHRNSISFSYGDTMLSFNVENRKVAGEKYQNPLCDRLFMLDELEYLFSNDLSSSQSPLAVEAQLWVSPTNEIVRKLER
ncbi:MAG: hypothetical protein IPJ84_15830 [Bdellovibrionales bacterium]|nr:hypothetical protein [Bdellovibrionales bacterium]